MRYQIILAAPLAMFSVFSVPAQAQTPPDAEAANLIAPDGRLAAEAPEVRALFEDMGLYGILDVMAAEGVASAPELEADMFPDQGGSAWRAVVADIYAADRLMNGFEAAVPLDLLTPEIVAELQAFYETDLGARVAAGELAARRAFLEPGVEEDAGDLARRRAAEGYPRIGILAEFIAVNDLIERNVSGALNSNFAFFRGLSDGGAFATEMPQDLMLAEVWGQEAEIRTETTEWLFAYQTLAYEDLTDAEMQAYIEMSATEAGQALNTVLFRAFAEVFDAISYDLGVAAAHFIASEET
jgi:hypothetical protein